MRHFSYFDLFAFRSLPAVNSCRNFNLRNFAAFKDFSTYGFIRRFTTFRFIRNVPSSFLPRCSYSIAADSSATTVHTFSSPRRNDGLGLFSPKTDVVGDEKVDPIVLGDTGDKKIRGALCQILGDLIKDRPLSDEECSKVRESCIAALTNNEKWTYISASGAASRAVDSRILKTFVLDSKSNLALSYVQYLLRQDLLNPAIIRIAAEILYNGCRTGMIDQSYLLHFLDKVLLAKFQQYVNFTPIIALFCVSPTNRWIDGLKMLEEFPQLHSLPAAHYLAAAGCFDNDHPADGFAVLQKFLSRNLNAPPLTDNLHSAMLNYVLRTVKTNSRDGMDLFLRYIDVLHDYRCLGIPVQFELDVRGIFDSSNTNWTVKNAHITSDGNCMSCRRQLARDELTTEEFRVMQKNLFDTLLKGEDVCRQSTPEELRKFEKFVEANKPFDIILDGLNVSMLGGAKKLTSQRKAERLANVVVHLKRRLGFKNILVVTRHHLLYKNPRSMAAILRDAKVFSLNDGSVDDPFILYAAMASGPNCFVVSNDTFGFLDINFDEHVRSLMQRWRRTQVINDWADPRNDIINVKFPPKHRIMCQFADNAFHLPLIECCHSRLNHAHFLPVSWLCVQQKH